MLPDTQVVVLLTGAGNGIGLAAVENMLLNGARVVAVDLKTEKLSSLKAHHDRQLEIITGDISERRTSELAVEAAVAKFQRLDCIVLNAGVLAPIGLVAETDVLAWKKLFDVNFFALLHTIQIAIPHLRKCQGSIIMTSSGVSLRPSTAWIAYACAKRAMNCLCAGLNLEEPQVSTVCITPGIVDTGMQKEVRDTHKSSMPKEQHDWLNGLYNEGRLIKPEQPAATFAKLALKGVPTEVRGEVVAWDDARVSG